MNDDVPAPEVGKPRRWGYRYRGVVAPGRFLRTRAIVWGVVLAAVLDLVYIQAARHSWTLPVGVQVVVVPGVVLAIYLVAVGAIEFRWPQELALGRFVPELTAGLLFGTVLFALV